MAWARSAASTPMVPNGHMDTSTISDILTTRLRRDGDRPLVTAYDRISGERTELSVATVDNWVSKTANYLAEDLEVAPGEPVGVLLGTGWTTPVLLLACWRLGAFPAAGLDAVRRVRPATLFVAEERVGELDDLTAETVVVGRGVGGRLSPQARVGTPALRAFAEEVLAFADDYHDPTVDGGARAWAEPALSQSELVAATTEWPPGARVLSTVQADSLDGAVAVVGAVAREGSLVLVRGGAEADFDSVASDERVTHLHTGQGSPRPR